MDDVTQTVLIARFQPMVLLRWFEETRFSDWVLTSMIGFPLMLSLHAVGMAISVGLLIVLNLRLLGLFRVISWSFMLRALGLVWLGLCVNFLSGVALFLPRGAEYVRDPAFITKIFLICVGVSITCYLRKILASQSELWHVSRGAPPRLRFCAVISIFVWFGTIMSGRLIAYIGSF